MPVAIEPYVSELFERVGPVGDLYAVDAYEDEALWHIAIDDSATIVAEWIAARGVVVLSCDLGSPQAGQEARFHKLALQYNDTWVENGGVRLALDGAGSVTLLLDWVPRPGTEREFAAALRRTAAVAAAWREILRRGERAASEDFGSLDFRMIPI